MAHPLEALDDRHRVGVERVVPDPRRDGEDDRLRRPRSVLLAKRLNRSGPGPATGLEVAGENLFRFVGEARRLSNRAAVSAVSGGAGP